MSERSEDKAECCGRGGARPGCGRKPGIKTRPVRLPVWLLDALEDECDVRHAIIKACQHHYGIEPPAHCLPEESND